MRENTSESVVELQDWRLDEPSVKAFGGALNKLAPGMIAVATLAGRYAKRDESRQEIVIDKRAILWAVLDYSLRSSSNAAVSLTMALNRLKLRPSDTTPREPIDELVKLFSLGYAIVASQSVQTQLIPLARSIARLTVKRDEIDLRHMVMAMLYESAGFSTLIGPNVSPDILRELRAAVVAPLEKNRERSESITEWRKLVADLPIDGRQSKSSKAAQRQPKYINERIKLQLGDPARVDLLDRKPFADVLGDRINEVRSLQQGGSSETSPQAYIIHLHGPWGSGKSTILNFLRARLEHKKSEVDPPEWLVVDFNAWKYQRLRPPWWYLMEQIQRAAENGEQDCLSKWSLKLSWLWLRFRLGALYKQVSALAIGLALMLGYGWLSNPGTEDSLPKALLAFASLLTAVFGISNLIKSVIAKPETVAKAQSELAEDPYQEVILQFESLVARIKRPIIVFIDDVDRCDSGYVVDLLENIQTMLRSAPITYLVAADRTWITTAFNKRYVDFASHSQNSARPLGYLFLDKLFQLSVNMPSLSGPVRQRFLNTILGSDNKQATPTPDEIEAVAKKAEETVQAINSQDDLLAEIDKFGEETLEKQAVRSAVARRFSQTDVLAETEHRLAHLASLLEPNPRSMKNLISAVALNQSRLVLEGRSFDLDHIARWTMIELRWPLLAEWLSQVPERIEGVAVGIDNDDPTNKNMSKLLNDPTVVSIVQSQLNAAILRRLIGSAQELSTG